MSNTTYLDYFTSPPTCAIVKQCALLNYTHEWRIYDYNNCWEEELCPPPPWCRTSVRKCFIDIGGCQELQQCPENPTNESQLFNYFQNYTDTWRDEKIRIDGLRCGVT